MSNAAHTELSESVVTDGFHSLLKASLAQARAEGLLDDEELERSGQEVMIAAPALALFFAALQARGQGISMPDGSFTLSAENCPSSLRPYYDVWESCVIPIQSLSLEARHDLALLLCEKPAESSPLRADMMKLKADLQLVAMEINLRSSFQQRFGGDLQHALDANVRPRASGESSRSAQYEPPPGYEPPKEDFEKSQYITHAQPHTHPIDVKRSPVPPAPTATAPSLPPRPTSSHSRTSSAGSGSAHAHNAPDTLTLIRETLFSALADSLATTPTLSSLVVRGQRDASFSSRAYFAALSMAILDVALFRVDVAPAPAATPTPMSGGAGRQRDSALLSSVRVRAVQVGAHITPTIDARTCPSHLLPLLGALAGIARGAQALAERDDARAMRDAERDVQTREEMGAVWRLRKRLVGAHGLNQIPGSPNAREDEAGIAAVALAIQKLGMAMFAITDFGTRLAEALKVLAAIHTL